MISFQCRVELPQDQIEEPTVPLFVSVGPKGSRVNYVVPDEECVISNRATVLFIFEVTVLCK